MADDFEEQRIVFVRRWSAANKAFGLLIDKQKDAKKLIQLWGQLAEVEQAKRAFELEALATGIAVWKDGYLVDAKGAK
jgi:hypothetical protein